MNLAAVCRECRSPFGRRDLLSMPQALYACQAFMKGLDLRSLWLTFTGFVVGCLEVNGAAGGIAFGKAGAAAGAAEALSLLANTSLSMRCFKALDGAGPGMT